MQTQTPTKKTVSTTGSLVGLGAGLVLGGLMHGSDSSVLDGFAAVAGTFGELWIRALQMVVLPLVICNLIVAVTNNRGAGGVGRLGLRTLIVFLVLLTVGALFSLTVSHFAVGMVPVDPEALARIEPVIPETALRAAERGVGVGDLAGWISHLVPTNVLEAIVQGELLQIVVFALLLALAITQLPDQHRDSLVGFFRALNEAIFVLLHWILRLTSAAVFALALQFARDTGLFSLAGILGSYLVIITCLLFSYTVFLYLLGMLLCRAPAKTWAQALLPAQTVAISTRSSLATLPILIDGARERLRMPAGITGFVLPLAASTFKANRTVSGPMKLLFLAHVYGVDLTTGGILTFTVTALLVSFAAVGLPGGGAPFKTLPVYIALGIPVEGVVLLRTVEVIPDIFKTVCNTTGHMTAASIVTRLGREPAYVPAPAE